MNNNFFVIDNVLSDNDINKLFTYWDSIKDIIKIKNNNWDIVNPVITDIDTKFRKVRITNIQPEYFSDISNKIKSTCEYQLQVNCELEFPHYLTEYTIGSFHRTHIDNAHGYVNRDYVIGIQLSNPNSYSGGDLIVNGVNVPRTQGSLILYNGSLPHEVTPVLSGVRYSLTECISINHTNKHLI